MGQDPGFSSRNIHNRIPFNSRVGAKAPPRWKMKISGWAQESWNTSLLPQFNSVTQSCPTFATPWTAACQASPSITNSQSLLKLMPIKSVMPSSYLTLCLPLLLLPSILPNIRVFSNESVLCIRWPKDWSSSFSISPSNEYSGLTSFRIDWCDLLAVQGALKSLLQHHSSKPSILWHSAFFMIQLSHPYMTTGKSIALTRRTFVGKVMSLLFNILSRLVTAFLRYYLTTNQSEESLHTQKIAMTLTHFPDDSSFKNSHSQAEYLELV